MERLDPRLVVGLAVLALVFIWFGPEIIKSLATQMKSASPAKASGAPQPPATWPPRSDNDNVEFIREALICGGIKVASVDRTGAHGIIRLAEGCDGRDVSEAKRLICGDQALLERMSGAGLTTFAVGAPGYRTDASIESNGCGNNWRVRWEEK